jgi:hypothetical protein
MPVETSIHFLSTQHAACSQPPHGLRYQPLAAHCQTSAAYPPHDRKLRSRLPVSGKQNRIPSLKMRNASRVFSSYTDLRIGVKPRYYLATELVKALEVG